MELDSTNVAAFEAALGLTDYPGTDFLIRRGECGEGSFTVRLPEPGMAKLDLKPREESKDCISYSTSLPAAICEARVMRATESRKQGLHSRFAYQGTTKVMN